MYVDYRWLRQLHLVPNYARETNPNDAYGGTWITKVLGILRCTTIDELVKVVLGCTQCHRHFFTQVPYFGGARYGAVYHLDNDVDLFWGILRPCRE